jgi:hypothetical protein
MVMTSPPFFFQASSLLCAASPRSAFQPLGSGTTERLEARKFFYDAEAIRNRADRAGMQTMAD